MALEYTADNVEQAVKQFYLNPSLQSEVHFWLTGAQISPSAWNFCWDLMAPNKGIEVQYYGASCLHVKIVRFWHEIQQEHYESLKSKLLETIIQFASGPKVILTRLCVGLSALMLQMLPDNWPDAIPNLISTFQQEDFASLSSVGRCQILLEILTVLPEEFFSTNLTNHRRSVLRFELTKGLEHVLPLLQALLNQDSPLEIYEVSLKTFSRWVDFGLRMDRAEPLIQQVFASMRNPQLFDISCDTLVSVFGHPESYKYPGTVQRILSEVLKLQDLFNKALQEEDKESCEGICRVLISLSETHTKLIVESVLGPEEVKQNTMSLLRMILACTSLPGYFPVDESCSDQTFTFWYMLQDELSVISEEEMSPTMEAFKPVFFSLINTFLVKAKHPPDNEYNTWSLEEKEQLRCYRQDIGDNLMYSYNILGDDLLAHLVQCLVSWIENSKQGQVDWQNVEAILFIFSSISEGLPPDEKQYIPKLFSYLQQITFTNTLQISTALTMIGSFAEWIQYHPEILRCVLPLVLEGISNPQVGTAATIALKDITKENYNNLQPYAHQILQACQASLSAKTLKSRDLLRLMSSVGYVLSILQPQEIMVYLETIIAPHVQQLQDIADMQPNQSIRAEVHTTVNIFAWLFGALDTEMDEDESDEDVVSRQQLKILQTQAAKQQQGNESKPVAVVLQKISPIVEKIAYKWIFDTSIVEAVCELYKKAIQKMDEEFLPLAPGVIQIVINLYQKCPNTAAIDLSKQLLLTLGQYENMSELCRAIVASTCTRSLLMFDANIRNYTEVIEGFMCFMSQGMKKWKKLIFSCGCDLNALFQSAVIAMALPEHATVKAACSFLIEFLNQGNENEAVRTVVIANGHILVDRLMRAVGGESQRGIIDNISNVIMSLSKNFVQQFTDWLKMLVETDGYPSIRASRGDKEKFVKNLLRERMNKRKTQEIVKEFTLLCRGLLGTEYAQAAAAFL